jgi:predicted ATPase/DNA-binding SARP family transcriptional activator
MLEIRTLGGLSLKVNSRALENLGSRKAEALLVYLAVEGGRHNRSILASLLWPDSTAENTLTSMRVALSLLRKNLGGYMDLSRDTLGIKQDARVYLDASDLKAKVASGQMEKAMEIYKGDFLQGFHIRDSLEFEDWRRWEQEHLRRLVVRALHARISNAFEFGDRKKGQALVYQLLELDPLDELAHQQCMLLLAMDGMRAHALSQYEKCRHIMQTELGVEPSKETQELFQKISAEKPLTAQQPQLPKHNLPSAQTSFVGRQKELRRIRELIADPACRLLTLVGPGGIGKTRLALQAAAEVRTSFSDGVYFVPLESIDSPDYLISAIAGAIQLNIDSLHTTLAHKYQLFEYLRNRSILLVLDCFEHLILAAGLVSQLLGAAHRVKILVTSRQRLDLEGEWTFSVEGLPVSQEYSGTSCDDSSAVRLFTDRARQANTGFQLSEVDRGCAIRICQLVEGMPLGIELAATWIPLISIQEISEEMEKNLDFLASSRQDMPEKHRSLRAAFDSSWSLLEEEQRITFCKLSGFCGGFDRRAALQVAGASLRDLSILLDKSLLGRSETGRFFMHKQLQQYAAEKLAGWLNAYDEVHDQHCRYYADFLSQREPDLMGAKMITARQEIRQEIENLRSAVNWAILYWEAKAARKVLTGFQTFYAVQGWHEGKDAFREIALARRNRLLVTNNPNVLMDPIYLSAHIYQAFWHSHLGEIDESELISRECLEPLRECGLLGELSECVHNLGINASFRGEYQFARQLLEEAVLLGRESQHVLWPTYLLWLGYVNFQLGEYKQGMMSFQKCYDLFSSRGSQWGTGYALSKMGLAADGLGEHDQAMQYHREVITLFEENGDLAGKGFALSRMSMSAYFLREYPQAVEFGKAGYKVFQEIGHRWGMSTSLCRLGFAYLGLADTGKARDHFITALEQSRQNHMTPLSLYALAGLACTMAQEGETEKATGLFQYVLRHHQTPYIYVQQAARWMGDPDQINSPRASLADSKSGELEAIDIVIERVLYWIEGPSVLLTRPNTTSLP